MQQYIQIITQYPIIETEQCVICKGWFVKEAENSCPKCRLQILKNEDTCKNKI
jgi:hypothetical protein